MTITIAWTKRTKKAEQLLFVSDSRLSGGEIFDSCPKILCLNGRFAISFAGNSDRAFPMMIQLSLALESHRPSSLGQLSVAQVKSHALKIFDKMAADLSAPNVTPAQDVSPGVSFLFGGYSWDMKRFELWSIRFNSGRKRFEAVPAKVLRYNAGRLYGTSFKNDKKPSIGSLIAFGGDQGQLASRLLFKKIRDKYPAGEGFDTLCMEPFEVVRDMLKEKYRSETIGGAPQLANVRQNLCAESFGVRWGDGDNAGIYFQGRRLVDYERIDNPVIDPNSLLIEYPWLIQDAD